MNSSTIEAIVLPIGCFACLLGGYFYVSRQPSTKVPFEPLRQNMEDNNRDPMYMYFNDYVNNPYQKRLGGATRRRRRRRQSRRHHK